jgi:hypothetical protein
MTDLGNGQYEGRLPGLDEGDYSYEAVVQREGALMGKSTGTFSVGESNVEFVETRANHTLLRQLASRSGGRFYSADNIQSLARDTRALPGYRPTEVVRSREFAIWNLTWSLALAIVLFSVEWFIRKARGML